MSLTDDLATLREALDDALLVFVDTQWERAYRNTARPALAAVERLVEAARVVDRIYEGLRTDENDGEFALWSEDQLVAALIALRPALTPFKEES